MLPPLFGLGIRDPPPIPTHTHAHPVSAAAFVRSPASAPRHPGPRFRWVPAAAGGPWPAVGRQTPAAAAVGRRRHRLPRPYRVPGGVAGPARQAGAVSAAAAGRAGRHKSRFVTAAPALGPSGPAHPVRVRRAAWRPGGPFVRPKGEGPHWGAGDVARGGARAARVTAESDPGRAR